MGQVQQLCLWVTLLLLLSGLAVAADPLGGKKVMISVQYVAADQLPGKKIQLSMWEDGSGDHSRFTMDVDDNEPLGVAVEILFSTVANMRNHAAASRVENYTSDL
ncbi:hypothetical protein ACP4OV_019259 [Aristida adscensionis]